MVTVRAPLFSLDASGTLAGSIVFSKWKGRNVVRLKVDTPNPGTGPQTGVKSGFKYLAKAYAALPAEQRQAWDDAARPRRITGQNHMVGIGQGRIGEGGAPPAYPNAPSGALPDAATMSAALALGNNIKALWAAGMQPPDHVWQLYRSLSAGFEPGRNSQIAVLGAATTEYTDGGLSPATTYYYKVRGGNINGDAGPISNEVSATTDPAP